jgi:DsbC/DsbD-like thiol-disulfide interchange protein
MIGEALTLAAVIAAGAPQAAAAPERPRARVTATAPGDPVAPGSTTTVTLRVQLPDGVHVQSDRPRDPNLIPTSVTIEAPAGVSVEHVAYPAPSDFVLAGQRAPLLVFGHDFVVSVRLAVAASVDEGTITVPLVLRYQACNDHLCFAPARAPAQWTITVAKR